MLDHVQNEIPGVYIDQTPKLAMITRDQPQKLTFLPLQILEKTDIKTFINILREEKQIENTTLLMAEDSQTDFKPQAISERDKNFNDERKET